MREWTEEDQLRMESEMKSENERTVRRILADAEKKLANAEANHNAVGSASTERTMRKWEDMVRVCEMALESISQTCRRCESRRTNAKHLVNQLKEQGRETVPVSEVIDWLLMLAY